MEEIYSLPFQHHKTPFSIQIAGISYCDKTYKINRPASPISCFEYILEGTGTVITNGKTYHPKKGDAYLLFAGDDHLYYADPKEPWVKIWVNVHGDLVLHLVDSYGLRQINHIENCDVFHELNQIIEQVKLQNTNELDLLFHKFIKKLSTESKAYQEDQPNPAKQIKSYIDKHIHQKIRLDELAKCVYLSPSQTIRMFKKQYGITPYRYVTNQKIEHAKYLLKNTNLPIKEIADRLSFADEHYFSTFFKAETNDSPKQYRQK